MLLFLIDDVAIYCSIAFLLRHLRRSRYTFYQPTPMHQITCKSNSMMQHSSISKQSSCWSCRVGGRRQRRADASVAGEWIDCANGEASTYVVSDQSTSKQLKWSLEKIAEIQNPTSLQQLSHHSFIISLSSRRPTISYPTRSNDVSIKPPEQTTLWRAGR